jgi:hypothetical protein
MLNAVNDTRSEARLSSVIGEIGRTGAQRMLIAARHQGRRSWPARRSQWPDPGRPVVTCAGAMEVSVRRVNDEWVDPQTGERLGSREPSSITLVNRPGFPGGSKPWKGWSHGEEGNLEAVSTGFGRPVLALITHWNSWAATMATTPVRPSASALSRWGRTWSSFRSCHLVRSGFFR